MRGCALAMLLASGCNLVFPLPDDGDGGDAACPAEYAERTTGRYRLEPTEKTWFEADLDCRDDLPAGGSRHTHLVVTANDTELFDVVGFAGGPTVWVGLTDRDVAGDFHWITAEDALIVPRFPATPHQPPWDGTEPNDNFGSEDCVALRANGTLNDLSCVKDMDRSGYVCECDEFE